MGTSTHSNTHRRMKCFVEFIAPDPNKEEDMISKAKEVKKKIKEKAEADGLKVVDTPWSGSYAKKTGLRRFLRGNSAVEGQDIDLPFILEKPNDGGKKIKDLIPRFRKYIEEAYPSKKDTIKVSKKSVKFNLTDELSFDIVPMYESGKTDEQIIITTEGEIIQTSIQKHILFITNRTDKSNQIQGVVQFNECVRLMKWWREFQANSDSAYYLKANTDPDKDKRPSSMLIELLCAWAFDELSVQKTYADTLASWTAFLASQVKNRVAISFEDFIKNPKVDLKHYWSVLDPVSADNNVVSSWDKNKVDELADWLFNSKDCWQRIIRLTNDEEDSKCLDELVKLFGNPFRNNSDY
jgi:Second Messenger Oligonucleotide or Dinucleotide Synthetase domain